MADASLQFSSSSPLFLELSVTTTRDIKGHTCRHDTTGLAGVYKLKEDLAD
jgi:hypothetical protein